MLHELQELITNTNSRVIGQVLKNKTNIELHKWVMSESALLVDCTMKERIYYILNKKPNPVCKEGNKMTFNTKTHQYGFCDNISNCACFAAYISESRKGCDMSHVIDKRVETWLEKYGVENISQSATVQKKRSSTIKSRNYDNLYNRLSYDKQSQGFEQVVTRLATHVTPMFTRDSYIGSSRKNFYSWKCIICNNQFDDHVDYGRIPRCKTCYPHNKSKGELELQNYLDSLQIKYTCNDRSILGDLEYDIYIPEKKIAIEFNGVYWHSTEFKDSDYHVNKFLRSAEEGIHLISIFEDEWINKKEIVCSRLASVLGCSKTIPARKCKIVELSGKDYRQFVQQYHLQGTTSATYKYGLVYQSELISVMSFSKSRYTNDDYELMRYCSKDTVVGGAGKLFKYFITKFNPKSIISYANRCWSNGGLYYQLEFDNVTDNMANTGYWYIKNNIRYHRSSFTKNKLISCGADSALTESEIMNQYGYLKIYDCGNYKFRWKNQVDQ